MNRERTLAGGIAIVVMASLLAAALIPGAIAETDIENVRASSLQIEDVAIEPGSVSGGTATLAVETRLEHRGGPAENVSVLVRAVHADSGLVETTTQQDVPTIEGEREASVTQNISVERRGDYRIKTVVFRDGERIAEGAKEVDGVGTLKPGYAETNVNFHWQDSASEFPPIEYSIADAGDGQTTLNVSSYLTNQGDYPSENVRVVFTARQADSNIVADRVSVPVGEIEAGRTANPSASLSVADDYNYYLDAVLWKDGVVVGSARSAANLDPTEQLSVNETNREIDLSVSDFSGDNSPNAAKEATTTSNDSGQPGFTALAGVTALLVAGVIARRNTNDDD
ncbi:PGF-CTERM protein [Haladaptatus litoreus]|uniref:PGF-CTERM protein n=1 Tax=Haladaptatus litoreus TaxID=553468 RepID=A0A1N7B3T9_9EURY|nr:PGF-CTERM sorting domain-containing protein [Haladaptatus litoreus]SIR45946.1 PGF-CTERM protein [Haladaptatus litoreus]